MKSYRIKEVLPNDACYSTRHDFEGGVIEVSDPDEYPRKLFTSGLCVRGNFVPLSTMDPPQYEMCFIAVLLEEYPQP